MMNRWKTLLLALLAIAVSSAADGQTYTVLGSFNGTNGANPYGSLTISGTTLYGTTAYGGANGDGNIFSINTDGSGLQNLLSFSGTGGAYPGFFPSGSLTLSGSTLYGTTSRAAPTATATFSASTRTAAATKTCSRLPAPAGNLGPSHRQFDAQRLDAVWDDRNGGVSRQLWHDFQRQHGRQRLPKPALVQRHERRKSRGQFDAQRLNPLWDDRIWRRQRRWQDFQYRHERQRLPKPALLQRHRRRMNPEGSLTLSGSTLYGMTMRRRRQRRRQHFQYRHERRRLPNPALVQRHQRHASLSASLTLSGSTLYGMTIAAAHGDGTIFSIDTDGSGFQNLLSFNGTNGDISLWQFDAQRLNPVRDDRVWRRQRRRRCVFANHPRTIQRRHAGRRGDRSARVCVAAEGDGVTFYKTRLTQPWHAANNFY